METQNYQKLINNLTNPRKVKEAISKGVNILETLKNLKKHYYKISHDDYYIAKSRLDQNIEIKKSLREEIKKLEPLRDKATLTNREELEVIRINKLLENKDKLPETEKIITEKINEIEEQLKNLSILIKDSLNQHTKN